VGVVVKEVMGWREREVRSESREMRDAKLPASSAPTFVFSPTFFLLLTESSRRLHADPSALTGREEADGKRWAKEDWRRAGRWASGVECLWVLTIAPGDGRGCWVTLDVGGSWKAANDGGTPIFQQRRWGKVCERMGKGQRHSWGRREEMEIAVEAGNEAQAAKLSDSESVFICARMVKKERETLWDGDGVWRSIVSLSAGERKRKL
jgi:hypothetical protein